MNESAATDRWWPARERTGLRPGITYGALGLALAFAALPLYVVLPTHYAERFGTSLAALGGVLLAVRLLDALVDPLLGRWIDAAFARARRIQIGVAAAAAVTLWLGFAALFLAPGLQPTDGSATVLAWCGVTLAITCLGYSASSILHQTWGTRLGGSARERGRWVAWREGFALSGVLLASVLPTTAGVPASVAALAVALLAGLLALSAAPAASEFTVADARVVSPWVAWRVPAFRRLLAVYVINGVASAIPATLVLFFIRDRLQAAAWEPLFLVLYFVAGAASFPLWMALIARFSLGRCWLAAMALAVGCFGWAGALGPGDTVAYALVCIGSGLALGADVVVPQALLTGVIHRAGHGARHEGRFIGWWTAATKLNLALAAGLALPSLDWFGYRPGARDDTGLQALTWAYCLWPCALKACAAAVLWHGQRRQPIDWT